MLIKSIQTDIITTNFQGGNEDGSKYKRGSDMIVTCERIFQSQHLTMKKLLITFF